MTRIPSWKFDLLHTTISDAVREAGEEGLAFSSLPERVGDQLSDEQKSSVGSLGWHVTTVKLEMEVRGDLIRLPGSPQRLVLAG